MNKTTKWILIGTGVLFVLMFVLSKTGVFGKDEGVKVTTEAVKKRTIVELVNASGKVYPEIEVKISPDISGEITELYVKEGDTVKAGQTLGRIYADIYSLQRDQAASILAQSQAQIANSQAQVANQTAALQALKASLEQAQKTFDMQKKLFDDKVISKNEFNIAEANLKTAQANYNAAREGIRSIEAGVQSAKANAQSSQASLARANKDLSRTAIIAPMDGIISLMSVKKGERVVGSNMMAGTEMMRVADMSTFEVRVDVGENDVPKVKVGDKATITIDAYNDRKFTGVVTQVASSNNGAASASLTASTSTDATQYKVYIRILPDSYKDLQAKNPIPFRPGMSATADIETETRENVLSVPINAVTTRDRDDSTSNNGKAGESVAVRSGDVSEIVVFVVQPDQTVKKTKVSTSIQDINYIEITEGLKEGDEVVSGPYDIVSKTLKNGSRVKKTEKNKLYEKH
ncbi:MAG TPA: efflux RND transporter periplasmic adaptor subunit [Ferruginibacter sp.]|nr:efflux RND transporter periplasmic adaptor subunit [Ferruginibacter sp.]HRO16737.1 efflux RND transporter periplasmic adaptor subunit [Ferruginibacter sp.]HRQ19820.1 efflux RND transporter periplasmic adaptor subunit [Ferruginibacter sp.]